MTVPDRRLRAIVFQGDSLVSHCASFTAHNIIPTTCDVSSFICHNQQKGSFFFQRAKFFISFHTFGVPIVPFEEENEKQINWKERKMITQACKRLRTRDI